MQRLSQHQEIEPLKRRVKKTLKRLGPLRDLQVQLETIVAFQQRTLIPDFKLLLNDANNVKLKRFTMS